MQQSLVIGDTPVRIESLPGGRVQRVTTNGNTLSYGSTSACGDGTINSGDFLDFTATTWFKAPAALTTLAVFDTLAPATPNSVVCLDDALSTGYYDMIGPTTGKVYWSRFVPKFDLRVANVRFVMGTQGGGSDTAEFGVFAADTAFDTLLGPRFHTIESTIINLTDNVNVSIPMVGVLAAGVPYYLASRFVLAAPGFEVGVMEYTDTNLADLTGAGERKWGGTANPGTTIAAMPHLIASSSDSRTPIVSLTSD